MQTATIIINSILTVISFICFYLNVYTKDKYVSSGVKKAVFPAIVIGALISVLVSHSIREADFVSGVLIGLLNGLIFFILYLFVQNIENGEKTTTHYYDDGSPIRYFITGDKHRNFECVKDFCRKMNTHRKDVLIILGDAGFNYYGDVRDDKLKKEISELNITLFCLHGNKENRPQNIDTYGIKNFCGAKVYYEPQYPNICFAIDGEIYTFQNKKYMVVGGAHSIDKMHRIRENKPFWDDEMPDDLVKGKVEERLKQENNCIYGMMTHTCPIDYLPTEMFMSTYQNAVVKRKPRKAKPKSTFTPDVDRSTEEWFGKLEKQLDYKIWYCGHYHIDKQIDKVNMMYHEIRPLHIRLFGEE